MHCIYDPIGDLQHEVEARMQRLSQEEIRAFAEILSENTPGDIIGTRLSDRGIRATIVMSCVQDEHEMLSGHSVDSKQAEYTKRSVLARLSAESRYLDGLMQLEFARIFPAMPDGYEPWIGQDFVVYCSPVPDDSEESTSSETLFFLVG